jgi:hypothetical protein
MTPAIPLQFVLEACHPSGSRIGLQQVLPGGRRYFDMANNSKTCRHSNIQKHLSRQMYSDGLKLLKVFLGLFQKLRIT